ncbi:MAG TPA: helix-turn-helix transcriptional regulator [Pyrinomonadaceae bacterium]|jgi:DNA-binding Xre family transcriptional regulator
MITVKLREMAGKYNITNAYQLQKFTGFAPTMAYRLWKEKWTVSDLKTLNTLCNLFKCTPNDLLDFTPDPEEKL